MDDRISIIVPTYNRKELLHRLLESFSRLQCHCQIECIIIDDCSDDGTGMMVEDWRKTIDGSDVIFHRLPLRSGSAHARNVGITLATGNIIAFTDSDCIVDPQWAEQLYHRLTSDPQYAGVGGKVLPISNDIYSTYNTVFSTLEPQKNLQSLVGANCIFWKQPVIDVGMFDEFFFQPGGEEPALCMKLRKQGYRFGFEPKAVVFHDYRKTLNAFIATFLNYGRGEKILMDNRLSDYLQYTEIPERMDNSLAFTNHRKFLFFLSIRMVFHIYRQIPFLRRQKLSWTQRFRLLGLCALHQLSYHVGRGTFTGTLVTSVNRFIKKNPKCLVNLNSDAGLLFHLLELNEKAIPEFLHPGQRADAILTIRNTSCDRWVSAFFLIAMHGDESDPPFYVSKKPQKLLLSPNAGSAYGFSFVSPKQEKEYRLRIIITSPQGRPLSNTLEKKITVTSGSHNPDAGISGSDSTARGIAP